MDVFSLAFAHFFVRLLIGLALLSVAVSKLVQPGRFRKGIQEYQIIPMQLEAVFSLSKVGTYGIPLAELLASLGLISGMLFIQAIVLAASLLTLFSGAIFINLRRGRTDLSCHCGGALGNHLISWKLLVRNLVLIVLLMLLLWLPADLFTLDMLLHPSAALNRAMWIEMALPLSLLDIGILAISMLLPTIRRVVRLS